MWRVQDVHVGVVKMWVGQCTSGCLLCTFRCDQEVLVSLVELDMWVRSMYLWKLVRVGVVNIVRPT